MPVQRSYIEGIKDFLTFPGRTGPAFWEGMEAVFGQGSIKTVYNVLFNPTAADPDDLKDFSERFLNLDPGWTSFFVDTAMNPLTLMGVAHAVGGGAINLQAKPTPAGIKFVEEMSPLRPHAVTPYATLMERTVGSQLSAKAELLMHQRMGQFKKQFGPAYDTIKRELFGTDDAWQQAKGRVSLMSDGRPVPGATIQEVEAVRRIREEFTDPIWDRIGSIERLSKKDGQIMVDPEPIGYQTAYFMHMQNRQGWLSNDPKSIIATVENMQKYRQLYAAGKIEPLPFTPDTSISLSAQKDALLNWMQQPAAATLFNASLLKRSAQAIPDEMVDKLFVLDPDVVWNQYLHKAAKTYALQTPLSADEARFLHGRVIADAVPAERIAELNAARRQAYRLAQSAPDEATRQAAMNTVNNSVAELQTIYEHLRRTPEQHSLSYQITSELQGLIPGFDPIEGVSGRFRGVNINDPQMKIRARIAHDWYSLLIGKQDLERFALGNFYATALSKLEPHMTPKMIDRLNQMGAGTGMKDLGNKILNHITTHSDTYNAAGLERKLVSFTTANLLGLRPASVLMQMMQTPQMTIPRIGFGNTIAGLYEGVPKLARAYRETLRHSLEQKRLGRRVPFGESLRVGMEKHMPEYMASGIPNEYAALEHTFGEAFINGRFNVDKFTQMALAAFSAGEHLNRVIAFYGSRRMFKNAVRVNPQYLGYHIKDVLPDQLERDINLHAAGVVYDTQFVPTAGRLTPLQKRLGPAGRQFLSYPIGFANALLDMSLKGAQDVRSTQVGAQLAGQFGSGRSWLGYARYLAIMAGLTNFGRDVLGMDIGTRVQEGVVNLPLSPDTPFGMLPIPPIPGAVVSYATSALTGKLDKGATTDIPGYGTIPIPKAFFPFGMLVSQIARMTNQTKDGMMLDREGRGLQDFDTKAMIASMLGLTTMDSARDNQKAKRLLYTAEKVKGYRHQLALALANADLDAANQAKSQYYEEFPDAPELSVNSEDIVRVKEQQQTTRLQRISQAVGANIRGIVDPQLDPAGWYEPYYMESATTRGMN